MLAKVVTRNLYVILLACAILFCNAENLMAHPACFSGDTLTDISLDRIVITANRFENKTLQAGSAIGSMSSEEISLLPAHLQSNPLKYMPGLHLTSRDGMGINPQIILRGFTGGGVTDNVLLLIDGIPVNDLESGLASWNMLPLMGIGTVEVLRGGASALWGDMAMGGAVNFITEKKDINFTNASAGYGSFNSYNIGLIHGGRLLDGFYEFYTENLGSDGFRDHSNWNSVTFGGKFNFSMGRSSSLTITARNQLLNSNDPGPVSENQTTTDRTASGILYREDSKDYKKHLIHVDYRYKVNRNTDMNIALTYQHKKSDKIHTYSEPPPILNMFTSVPIGVYDTTLFGNSKNRKLTTDQVGLAFRLLGFNPDNLLRVTGGMEAEYGSYDNEVLDVFAGFEHDYQNNFLAENVTEFTGNGYRLKTSAYINSEIPLFDPLKLIAGARYDFVADAFDSDVPVADTSMNRTFNALSPRIVLNLSTGESEEYRGSIFAGFNRALKTPSIDQRTDLTSLSRAVFFEAGPAYQMEIIQRYPVSDAQLKPQRSNNYELGTHQFYRFSRIFAAEISIIGYVADVENEIVFDLTEYKYRNIKESRHTGLESAISLHYNFNWKAFININFSDAKFVSGENEGKNLKGVPKLSQVIGVTHAPRQGFGGSLIFSGASGMFLDDKNTEELEPYALVDARINCKLNFVTVYLDVNNIFNKSYSSTGYLLNETEFLFPTIGRFIRGGLLFEF